LPDNLNLNCLITFLYSNIVIVLCYLFQDKLTTFHNRLRRNKNGEIDSKKYYYGFDFVYRTIYMYFLALAASLSERTYWDLYDMYTLEMHWAYFSSISLIGFFVYRFSLRKSLDNFTNAIPCFLIKDDVDGYFLESKCIDLKNVI
jgi:hypothetical protein